MKINQINSIKFYLKVDLSDSRYQHFSATL